MIKNIVIVAPNYDPKSGGAIALHKLCHIFNQMGQKSYLCPAFENRFINVLNCEAKLPHLNDDLWRLSIDRRVDLKILPTCYPVKDSWLTKLKRIKRIILNQAELPLLANSEGFELKTNPHLNTPTLSLPEAKILANSEDTVVIYAEIMAGNPLEAKNVVRWLLHNPGFHSGHIYYEPGELYFRFNSAIKPFTFPGSITSEQFLEITHYPLDLYNLSNSLPESQREGTAYCRRKGAHKPIQHNLNNSICIDKLPHEEVAKVFKRVTHFYCYDTLTAYYHLAAICGCKVVLIPDEGVAKENWLTSTARLGIAYGIAEINSIEGGPEDALRHLQKIEVQSTIQSKKCLAQMNQFFEVP